MADSMVRQMLLRQMAQGSAGTPPPSDEATESPEDSADPLRDATKDLFDAMKADDVDAGMAALEAAFRALQTGAQMDQGETGETEG